jgi:hypothetical protein
MRALLVVSLVAATGCATSAGRAPGFLVRGLNYEGRLLLLDAEEKLAEVQARADEAGADQARAQDEVGEAAARVALVASAPGWGKEAAAQQRFAEASLAWAQAAVAVAEREVTCARVRYELAKVEVAQTVKVEGAAQVDPSPWGEEADRCEGTLSADKARLRALATERARLKASWEDEKGTLARKSSRARPGPFVE